MAIKRKKGGNTMATEVRTKFSTALREQMERKQLRARDFAKLIGCSENGLSAVLNGQSFPTRYLGRMCEILDVEITIVDRKP
jgi:transcriptional regulator with XRE-family HTH domain